MNKIIAALMGALLITGCAEEKQTTPKRDTSVPALSYPLISIASTIKFVPFGGTLPNATTSKGYNIQLTDTSQIVTSVCPGIVDNIAANSDGASTVTVIYKPLSVYSFVYTGVRVTHIQTGDTINAGTILGKIAASGIINFKVIKNEDVLCPETFGSAGFNNSIQSAINRHNQNNPADTVATSCLVTSLPK